MGNPNFTDDTATIASPISGFVGIVDGKFAAIYPYGSIWTTKNGDQIHLTCVETVALETIILPDGTPVPDLNKVSHSKIFQTVIGDTGHFEGMEGVTFANAVFTPVGTDAEGRLMISAKWAGSGALTPRR